MLYDVTICFEAPDGNVRSTTSSVEAVSVQAAHNKAVAAASETARQNLVEVKVRECATADAGR